MSKTQAPGDDLQAYTPVVSPEGVRFQTDSGAIFVSAEELDTLNTGVRTQLADLKPIDAAEVSNIVQMIAQRYGIGTAPEKRLVLVNVMLRNDQKGYIVRFYDHDHDREWNCSTMGEYRAMTNTLWYHR